MKPTISPCIAVSTVPKELIDELTDLLLSICWVLEYDSRYITGMGDSKTRLYFKPLILPIGFCRGNDPKRASECNTKVVTNLFKYLVENLAEDKKVENPKHLFLKVLTPGLQMILRDPNFGDQTPLMIEFCKVLQEKKPNLFEEKRTARGAKPYWAVNIRYSLRAVKYKAVQNRERWTRKIAQAIYLGHKDIQRDNVRLSLGLIEISRQ